jgi:hypothetical protein
MSSNFIQLYDSNGVPLFNKAKAIILKNQDFDSVEYIVSVLDELSKYEREIQKIMELLIESTYFDIQDSLIEPIEKLFEEEYLEH